MDPIKFGQDLARKADLVHSLATHEFEWPNLVGQSLVFIGMGSSAFAAQSIVARLQTHAIDATLSLASNPTPPLGNLNRTLIAISASGKSVETTSVFDSAQEYREQIWLTNGESRGQASIAMNAGVELGGVASLSYLATHIALLRLCESLGCIADFTQSIHDAAEAIDNIHSTSQDWLPKLVDHINSPSGSYFIAPADRFCNAQQGALMLRELPRLPSSGCETGDWSHIDVYLTNTLDYRAIIFPGSFWESQFFKWTNERATRVATIGFENPTASVCLRYKNDSNPIVRLLAETTYAEILAQQLSAN